MSFLPAGSPAPDFSLTAVVSERTISPTNITGQLLLIFHGYQAAALVGRTIEAIRAVYPDPQQLLIASVADMRIVPRLLRGMAEKIMGDAYHQAAAHVPSGQEPADHIIILPDWQGRVFAAYQIPENKGQVALVLIDQDQLIQDTYLGHEPQEAALALLNSRR